jgi:hypothetical protein
MSFSVSHQNRLHDTRHRHAPLLAVHVWLRRGALSRAIAAGADPSSSPELARRARQLTSNEFRLTLAAGLTRILKDTERNRAALTAAVPLQRREIIAARNDIERLAQDLRGPDEVQSRGMALVDELLTDGCSPFYTPGPKGELDLAVRRARAALLLR